MYHRPRVVPVPSLIAPDSVLARNYFTRATHANCSEIRLVHTSVSAQYDIILLLSFCVCVRVRTMIILKQHRVVVVVVYTVDITTTRVAAAAERERRRRRLRADDSIFRNTR